MIQSSLCQACTPDKVNSASIKQLVYQYSQPPFIYKSQKARGENPQTQVNSWINVQIVI